MEEYTQITIDQWTQWKEDIRQKLAETAGNFVYIGYRLKQIRDSGMYDGAADVFEFAQREYGLGKSTVSRFIAINGKYSEGGNSLELKEEFRRFSSSKLSEMLTLPDSEIQLITEKTTIREIRELKNFNNQAPEEEAGNPEEPREAAGSRTEMGGGQQPERTPLEKCLIDFFRTRRETLEGILRLLDPDPPEYKEAADLMAPSGQASHRKGIVFLFLYDWDTGIKYKLMTQPDPVSMAWPELLETIRQIYGTYDRENVWKSFYEPLPGPEKEAENARPENTTQPQSDQGLETSVATSQQEQKGEENEALEKEPGRVDPGEKNHEESGQDNGVRGEKDRTEIEGDPQPRTNGREEEGTETAEGDRCENKDTEKTEEETPPENGKKGQIPGQDSIMNHPEYLPPEMKNDPEPVIVEEGEVITPSRKDLRDKVQELASQAMQVFWMWNGNDMPLADVEAAKENAEQIITICDRLMAMAEDGWIKAD